MRLFREEMRAEVSAFRKETIQRFDAIDQQFKAVDARFDELDRRMDNSNKHLVATDARLSTEVSAVRGAAHEHEDKQSQLDDRVTNCEREIDELKKRDP